MPSESPEEGTVVTGASGRSASGDAPIMVPVFEDPAELTVDVGLTIASHRTADVLFLKPVTLPEQTPLHVPDSALAHHRDCLQETMERAPSGRTEVRGVVRIGRNRDRVLRSAIAEHSPGLVVMGPDQPTPLRPRIHPRSWIGEGPTSGCDSIVLRGTDPLDDISSMLVSIAGGSYDDLTVDVALAIADGTDARVDLHGMGIEGGPGDADQAVADVFERHPELEHVQASIRQSGEIEGEPSTEYDLVVTPHAKTGWLDGLFGRRRLDVHQAGSEAVLRVEPGATEDRHWLA